MTEATDTQQYSFKAETKQLLNILIHSLYKEREVFLRELLSNASDALNRLRFETVTNRDVLDMNAELKIHITVDKDARMLTIQDTGIGMTKDEVIENLGTIAQSGARKFIEATKDKNTDLSEVIGQLGVGFYSVFMAAEWVRVTSRSFSKDAEAVMLQLESVVEHGGTGTKAVVPGYRVAGRTGTAKVANAVGFG